MAETFNAAQIIGKTLFAKTKIGVYRDASDSAEPYGYVSQGQPVGVVYSWLDPNPGWGRSGLWWVFKDINAWYYVPHKENIFDVSELKKQGAITVTEQVAIEKEKQRQLELESMPWYKQLAKTYGPWVLGAYIAVNLLPPFISGLKNK